MDDRITHLPGRTEQQDASCREFTMQFTSTPRGARLARRLLSHRLDEWGYPYDSTVNETLTLIAAELTSNAVQHGHVPGRDFHVRLTADADHTLRIEVADTRIERHPPPGTPVPPPPDRESGRGLFLVSQLADCWGATPRPGAPGKRVWAEVRATTVTTPGRTAARRMRGRLDGTRGLTHATSG